MLSQRESSLKGVFCAIDTACGMESVIQKLANSAPGSVNLLHDSWGNTGWVTKRLIVAAPRARSAWKKGRRELVDNCTFRWLKMPLASYVPTTQAFCPRFCPATSLERTKLKDKTRDGEPATRLDILLGQLLDGHTLATCIMHTHSATDDSIYLGTLDECASCLHQIIHYHHMSVLWFT